jgi:hypothetical protein
LVFTANGNNIVEIDTGAATFNIPIQTTSLTVNGTHFNNGIIIVKSSSNSGNIKSVPFIDNNESSIGFFKKSNLSINDTGDVWLVGRNISNLDPNVFFFQFHVII